MLEQEPRGVLAVHGEDGYPYALPMDFVYDRAVGKLYFHCAKQGHKVDALRRDDRVSFCIHDEGYREEEDWALNIRSVIVFGRIRFVEDRDETVELVRMLGLKYYPTPEEVEEEIRKAVDRVQMLELTVDHMTGKLVNES